MVYVTREGTMANSQPFGLSLLMTWFWGVFNFIYIFFQTLINPNSSKRGSQYTQDFRAPGGGPPKPPTRKFGGFGPSSSGGSPPMPGCGCGG